MALELKPIKLNASVMRPIRVQAIDLNSRPQAGKESPDKESPDTESPDTESPGKKSPSKDSATNKSSANETPPGICIPQSPLRNSDFSLCYLIPQAPPQLESVLTTNKEMLLQRGKRRLFGGYDLIAEYAASNDTPIFYSSLRAYLENAPFRLEMIRKNLEYFDAFKALGYADCYLIPFYSNTGGGKLLLRVAIKGLRCEEFMSVIEANQDALKSICEMLDSIAGSKISALSNSRAKPMSNRPVALLRLLAEEGMSLREAAEQLNISVDTANKHVATAKKYLGVRTQAAAVYKAIEAGILNLRRN